MSDTDIGSDAWLLPPGKYLQARTARHRLADPTSCYVTMRDGCRLAVDAYVPAGTEDRQFPTIVIFTPYFRRFAVTAPGAECTPNIAKYRDFFVKYGYALVAVDVRGTGASFGTRESFRSPKEREDSREIADWICAQPWSNGVIGSTGISYLGAAACFLASTGHPGVRAIAPLFSVSDIYNEQLFPGGILSRIWSRAYDELMLALDHNDVAIRAKFPYFNDPRLAGPQPVDEDPGGTLAAQAVLEHRDNFRLHDMMPELAFRDEGTLHDPSLTSQACSPYTYLLAGAKPGVPIYSISGWQDGGGYANGSITRFLTMGGPDDRLLLGPWDHGARTNVSQWRSQPTPEFPLLAEVLRFFDEHLMGIDTGLRREAPIHYFSMHGERWHAAATWPPVPSTRLYLAPGNALSPEKPAQDTAEYQVRFDTTTGTETRWERLGTINVQNYYFDWNGRDERLLNFTSDVFEEDTELSGHIVVNFSVASSQADAALFIYAAEVEPDGTRRYMTDGQLRALHRQTAQPPKDYQTTWPYRTYFRSDARLMTPGEATRMEFALLPVSWTIKAGSRLRISIAGADVDHFPQVPHGLPPKLTFTLGGSDASFIDIPLDRSPT